MPVNSTTDRTGGATAGGLLLGVGLGGFVDGIVLHQILQWHHVLTDQRAPGRFPPGTVNDLEANTLWDGIFHAGTWVVTVIGVVLMWRALRQGARLDPRPFVGLLLLGWGMFNVVEGVVDHHLLSIHHVRDDVADPLWWDLAFLAFGAALVAAGAALSRREPAARPGLYGEPERPGLANGHRTVRRMAERPLP
jgi:uncharacterized membrane protein